MSQTKKRVLSDQRVIIQIVSKHEYTGNPVIKNIRVTKESVKRSAAEIAKRQKVHDECRAQRAF